MFYIGILPENLRYYVGFYSFLQTVARFGQISFLHKNIPQERNLIVYAGNRDYRLSENFFLFFYFS